ncbi:MAG: glycoside hydrolase family 3 N-terminal domain-containing protein [Cyanobacteria bacterium P01_E01_bin.35]
MGIPNWQQLPLKEQIAQMIVVRASGHLFDHQILYPAWEANNDQLKNWLSELNLGGVILLGGSSIELQLRSQQLQSWAKTPLLIAADIEEGIGQRFPGGTWFPPPMALNEIYRKNPELAQNYAYQVGQITAQEALVLGINWLLAPVVDVNNNPDNPVINIRAYSDRPKIVSALTSAFIRGAKTTSVLTTAKHFPGHGDTITDSHLALPTLSHSDSRLAAVELPPFEQAIANKVDSVMTAHLLISAWDQERPATLSKIIVTDKLRQQLGFSGLVVTDALIMEGIKKFTTSEEVYVMAIEAGSDILLMPDDPETAITAIYNAVQSGRITEQRIHKSLERIWQAKNRVFARQGKASELFGYQAKQLVKSILEDSLQRNGITLDSNSHQNFRNLIVVNDVLNTPYLDINSPSITIPQQLGYERLIVDNNSFKCILEDSRSTLLQIFIRGNPFRGNAGLTFDTKQIYQRLIVKGQVLGIVIYGSPYAMEWFRNIIDPDLPWVFSYGQMNQAQAIALNSLFVNDVSMLSSRFYDFGF